MPFFDKLAAATVRNHSLLVVGLDPNPELMPAGDQDSALIDQLWNWLQGTIAQTADLVCAYRLTLGFYEVLGASGLQLLERVLRVIPSHIPVILDAKHSDLNTSTLLARLVFTQWQVDAITLNPYAGQDLIAPFLVYPGKAVFLLCCTSNPSATEFQSYPTADSPLYLHIVTEAQTWGTLDQLGLEVGTTTPEVLSRVRTIALERLILLRSLW